MELIESTDHVRLATPPPPASAPSDDRPYRWFGVFVLLLTFGVFGGWSAVAPLDSAIVAPGQVKVEARRKVVQHLEGGIVAEIGVEDGDRVEAGTLLMRLSDVSPAAQLRIVRLQLYSAQALAARLEAERDGAEKIDFPAPLLAAADEGADADAEMRRMLNAEQQVFDARRHSHLNEIDILRRRVHQLQEQAIGVEGLLEAQQDRLVSYTGEVAEWQRLYDAKLADKVRLLQLQRELAELEGDHASTQARLAELHVAIGETEAQIVLAEQQYLSEVTNLLRETQSKTADLSTREIALKDTLARTEIRSPVDGVVVGLRVRTIGAVVAPGEALMEIVPASDDLIVIANISLTDIDSMYIRQSADIRFSAFDSRMTHVVPGEVTNISADAILDNASGMQYYEAQIRIVPDGYQQMRDDDILIVPGMPAEVMIKTGGRTLLNYLLKPFLDMVARSFREQ